MAQWLSNALRLRPGPDSHPASMTRSAWEISRYLSAAVVHENNRRRKAPPPTVRMNAHAESEKPHVHAYNLS